MLGCSRSPFTLQHFMADSESIAEGGNLLPTFWSWIWVRWVQPIGIWQKSGCQELYHSACSASQLLVIDSKSIYRGLIEPCLLHFLLELLHAGQTFQRVATSSDKPLVSHNKDNVRTLSARRNILDALVDASGSSSVFLATSDCLNFLSKQ